MPKIRVTCNNCNHSEELYDIEMFDEYYGECSWCEGELCDACRDDVKQKMHEECVMDELTHG